MNEPDPSAPFASSDTTPDTPAANAPFDLTELTATMEQHLQQSAWALKAAPAPEAQAASLSPADPKVAECLEELAEDMLDLLQRIRGLEAAQTGLAARLDLLAKTTEQGLLAQAREVDALRCELLVEKEAFVSQTSFNALIPVLDRFRLMRAALSPKKDGRLTEQLDAVLEILNQAIRTLGFRPFEPAIGAPFDPRQMACRGHKKGAPGVVLGVDRPGYLDSRGEISRPAGVILAAVTEARKDN